MEHRELLFCRLIGRVEVLVPKTRGRGFLKVPLGHKMCPLAELGAQSRYDFYGLDGSLQIYRVGLVSLQSADFEDVVERVIPSISALLGFPAREIKEHEFWSLHPRTPPADLPSSDTQRMPT